MATDTWIVASARTPIGSLGGTLSSVPAPMLSAACVEAVISRAGVAREDVDDVIMGNVVSTGIGQNPARQEAIRAGLPPSVGATTVNKVCGSGLKAVMLADQAVRVGEPGVGRRGRHGEHEPRAVPVSARAPGVPDGAWPALLDSMGHDGLWDVYGGEHMGHYGDACAAK